MRKLTPQKQGHEFPHIGSVHTRYAASLTNRLVVALSRSAKTGPIRATGVRWGHHAFEAVGYERQTQEITMEITITNGQFVRTTDTIEETLNHLRRDWIAAPTASGQRAGIEALAELLRETLTMLKVSALEAEDDLISSSMYDRV